MSSTELTHPDRLPLSAGLTDSLALAERQLLRTMRTPQAAIAGVVSPILFLTLFRYVFGGAIPIPGMTYADYIVPAMLLQNIVFGGFGSASGLAQDAIDGILDRFRSLPTPRPAVLTGRALADTVQQFLTHALVIGTGLVIGFRFHAGTFDLLLAVIMLLVIGASCFTVFAAMGLGTRNPETVQSLTPPFFLLLFVSSAFIPVVTLPGWLRGFATYQPITIFTDTLRDLTQGPAAHAVLTHDTDWYLTASLIWCAVLTALAGASALRSYRRL